MSPPIVVIGGGAHGRVVMEAIRSETAPRALLGFVDPEVCAVTTDRLGVIRLGDEVALTAHPGALGVLGFGTLGPPASREEAVRRLTPALAGWAVVVHRAAWVSPTATMGEGTVILAGAVVQTGAVIGGHCVVNSGAIVEHDAVLGDHVQLAPRAAIGGGAQIGPGAYIGLGAVIRDHVSVGARAVVGMGAVVVGDISPGARVMGVPAR